MSRVSLSSLAVLAGFALACGGGDRAPVEKTAPPPAPTPPPAQKGGIAAAKARGTLRVAADPEAPPFLSKDAKGDWEGYEYAIANAIADRAGVPLEFVPATFPDLVGKVTDGTADLAIGQVSPSAAWQGVDWSVSYLQYSMCLVVPAESKVEAIAELKGKRVGMYDDPVARQLVDVLIGASYERQLFEDYGYFEKLVRGALDAMVYDCPLARYEMKTFGDKLKVVDDALNVATYAVAVPAGDPDTLAHVNGVLKDLGETGLLATLQERLLGEAVKTGTIETATGKVIIVGRGDSLSAIAKRELGDTERWKDLYAANKDVVGPDANVVYVGMRLRLPR